ncbi:hypothetical protein ACTHGU_14835 [Chitinophagaceae bacterium MMS25-I14]
MKYLMLIIACLTAISLQAQEMKKTSVVRKKTVHHHTTHHHSHKTANKTYYFPKSKKAREAEKSIDDGTTGVMGEEQVKMNKKGMKRNLNANTGVPLPPTSGSGGK